MMGFIIACFVSIGLTLAAISDSGLRWLVIPAIVVYIIAELVLGGDES
jgi:hypothetical protein